MNVCLVLAATWIWWTVTVRPTAWVCSSSLLMTGNKHNNNLNIDTVKFKVTGCTKKSYTDFLESLRTHLRSSKTSNDIPLLPTSSASVKDLILVELFDWGDAPITLVLNRTNAYVIAYEVEEFYYLLYDTPHNDLYKKSRRLTFQGSYNDLQRVAKKNRENINLGINELAVAINTLYYWTPPKPESSVALSLIVLIQMVSEAARFGKIEERVVENILEDYYVSFLPGILVMDLETNWGKLSTAVQQSIDGEFKDAVEIKHDKGKPVKINNVNETKKYTGLALLLALRQSQALFYIISTLLDIEA